MAGYLDCPIQDRACVTEPPVHSITDSNSRSSALELRGKGNWGKGKEGGDLQNIVFCSMGIFALVSWKVFLNIRVNGKDAAKL